MKVYIRNQQRSIKVNQQKIVKLLRKALQLLGLQKAELSILFVNDRTMKMLNRTFRGVDKTTDVLSFPQQESYKLQVTSYKLKNKKDLQLDSSLIIQNLNLSLPPFSKGGFGGIIRSEPRTPHFVLGDIVINLHRARRQAIEQGITLNEELKRLTIHGLLHLLGYNHDKNKYQKKKMEVKEKELFDVLKSL